MTYREFWETLSSEYEPNEAKAIARLVFEKALGLSLVQIYSDSAISIISHNEPLLQDILKRLLQREPVQYVLGKADFFGREFAVSQGVLIPRPETEELIKHTLTEIKSPSKGDLEDTPSILDCCTGSGCIAITLSLELEKAQVSAFDISDKALTIARKNAKLHNAKVNFFNADALNLNLKIIQNHSEPFEIVQTHNPQPITHNLFNLIISNPPYVCETERAEMQAHVLNYEPAEALFVPDNNPLLFYNAISDFSLTHLYKRGILCFEINPHFAQQIADSLAEKGFSEIKIKKDQFGKNRFIFAKL